ncbi:DUF4249 family protein [Flavobacterium sp.]|uniref:DUF4249 family protein n=1 Tax=Flavobacterium sp. TaxID=239 RepID=UPI003C4D7355
MKKINILIALLLTLFLNGCQEVIDVDLNTGPPKLIVEASIKWLKGTTGKEQKIKLTTTTSYYSSQIPTVSGAIITVKNRTNNTFNFIEINNTGEYLCTDFIPVLNEVYTLNINLNGVTYTATEILASVAPIEEIIQNNEGGFSGKDIQLKTYFTDPANQTNFYLFQYIFTDKIKQTFYADEDTLFQGNRFFSLSRSNEIKKGDEVIVTHYGISKTYYNYLNVLISIAGGGGGGPFQSPPATVRGNIINTTNKADYALGYFNLSEIDSRNYTVQ